MDIFINALLHAFYTGLYFIVIAILSLLIRYVFKIKGEVYRKILHLSFMSSIFCWLYIFDYWYTSLVAMMLFLFVAIVGLTILERFSFYKDLLAEREEKGEVKKSLTIAFLVFALGISVFWGIFGETYKYIVLASVLAWGIGDASAALLGKAKGAHKVSNAHIKTNKTVEGAVGMMVFSALTLFIVLFFGTAHHWTYAVFYSLFAGVIGSLVELISKNGWDTLTLPIVFMVILTIGELLV